MARRANLVLVGFMGAGKSVVGRAAAERLDMAFVDADAMIEADAGQSIPDIFAAEGESGFRSRERRVLAMIAAEEGLVVATGGGAFVQPDVRERLMETGVTIHLDAPFDVLWERVGAQPGRPLLAGEGAKERAESLYCSRLAEYQKAHARVDANRPLPEVVQGVVEVYRERVDNDHH